jgi:crossover junction endodeoxyribonuclease RuvC
VKVVGIDPGTTPRNPSARVRQGVCGYGRAEKTQVQEMTRVRVGLERTPTPSTAADALAVAICHALAPRLLQASG